MHRFSLAVACVAGVLASQAGWAESRAPFNFAKADTSAEQFRHDRNACVAKAKTFHPQEIHRSGGGYYPDTPGGPPQIHAVEYTYGRPAYTGYDGHDFLRCMLAKGYQETVPPMPAGKPGLYELRQFSNRAMFEPRYLATALPFAQQRASAEALARPGAVHQLCVAPNGTQQLGAVAGLSSSCTYSNIVSPPRGFVADASCAAGKPIHVAFEAATPDRREFTVYRQPLPKAAVPVIEKYQVNWLSPDCGGIPPGTVRTADGKLVPMAPPKPPLPSFESNLP